MEASTDKSAGIVFTEKELARYAGCPELLFSGGHTSGFTNCAYCATVYRSYRRLQNEQIPQGAPAAEEKEEEPEGEEEAPKQKSLDDNAECTKLPCMKAGWCMCE